MKRKIAFAFLLAGLLVLAAAGVLVGIGLNDRLGPADLALVLGNKVNPDGTPSPRLRARLDVAADLYRKGYFPKILVSGGTGKEGVPEGTAMKTYLVGIGLPAAAILVDDHGVDTHASAVNTAAVLRAERGKSVFVITQYFHVPRSKLALARLGVAPIFHAHPAYFELRDVYSTLRELPAFLKYLLRPPPAPSDAGVPRPPAASAAPYFEPSSSLSRS